MATNGLTPVLFVTANVGSLFEDSDRMLTSWVAEFLQTVRHFQPRFVALHCQEVGGKSYEGSMKNVEDFVRMLMGSEEFLKFDRMRVFLDEDYTSSERFTALGNFYFLHETLQTVEMWDFKEQKFEPCQGKEVHTGNIEDVPSKEKMKFSQEYFPECKWSRKGYLRTRWNIDGTLFDLINIHLLHDASNLLAIESFPSIYSDFRHRALRHVLERLKSGDWKNIPFFIFGDFNFRVDMHSVVQRLTNETVPLPVTSNKNGEISKIVYKEQSNENKVILTIGKKEFDHHDQHGMLFANHGKWLKEYDKELKPFSEDLLEFPIEFAPSYPYCEDTDNGASYMRTRCPAWCDRIVMSKTAKSLVAEDGCNMLYNTIGQEICMGDHKPVFLSFWMHSDPASVTSSSADKDPSIDLADINLGGLLSARSSSDSATVTRYIHVRHPGSPVRIFRETTV